MQILGGVNVDFFDANVCTIFMLLQQWREKRRLYNKVTKAKKMKAQTDRGGWHGRIGKTLQRIWFLCLQGWKERDNFAA